MTKPTKEERYAELEILIGKLKDAIETEKPILLSFLVHETENKYTGGICCWGGTTKMSSVMRRMVEESFSDRP